MLHLSNWKITLVLLTLFLGLAFSLPNVLSPSQRDWLARNLSAAPAETVNLGLDLQGGSHLLLQVDLSIALDDRIDAMVSAARSQLRRQRIGYRKLIATSDGVSVDLRDPEDSGAVRDILSDLEQGIAIEQEAQQLRARLTEQALTEIRRNIVSRAIEIVRRRIDETGTREPVIQAQGEDRILVQLPGVQDPDRIKDLLGKTAKMTFHMVDEEVMRRASAEQFGQLNTPVPASTKWLPFADRGGAQIAVKKTSELGGELLIDSQQTYDETNQPAVSFRFNALGARRFGEITQEHLKERFAVVIDETVITAPVIQTPILGGIGQITGNFTLQEALDLALVLRSGALPAPLKVLEERTVGPSLGADSVQAGKLAALVALGAVLIFMVGIYRLFGLFAAAALLANVVLIFGALSMLQATLTLPGIAGIVLTIGMAVDANVLVFERIREEIKAGRSALSAIDKGYQFAMSTIVDANLTTLIAALILYAFGTGPIRGFAVTLGIGIVTSMFSAILVTRLFIVWWLRWKEKTKQVPIGGSEKQGRAWQFMRWRHAAAIFSIIVIAIGMGLFTARGLNLGIDFAGGLMMDVRTEGAANLADLRGALADAGITNVSLQEFGSAEDVLLRARVSDGEDSQALIAQIKESLGEAVAEYRRIEFVGPQVGDELITQGALAVLYALAGILLYIWIRFEWPYAVAAIVALAHDSLATIGLFAVTQMEFNLATVAAVLMIAGYSINDTVVVFDRVRENLQRHNKTPLREILDLSLRQTLSRTMLTSGTTLIALIALAGFGGSVIQGFVVALIWGVIVGTYSSLYIASPLLLKLMPKAQAIKEADAKGQLHGV